MPDDIDRRLEQIVTHLERIEGHLAKLTLTPQGLTVKVGNIPTAHLPILGT